MTKCPLDGYPMDVDTDWLGRTVAICLDCTARLPRPTRKGGGQTRRCAVCRRARKRLMNHLSHRRRQAERGRPTRPTPGRCCDCGTPVTGARWRCDGCNKIARRGWDAARYERDKAKRLAACRERYWADPEKKRALSRESRLRNIVAVKRRRFGTGKWLQRVREEAA